MFHGLLDTDLIGGLRTMGMPALVLSGARDEMCHAEEDRFAASVSDVRRKRFEWACHAPHWEDPETVAGEILAFLEAIDLATSLAPDKVRATTDA